MLLCLGLMFSINATGRDDGPSAAKTSSHIELTRSGNQYFLASGTNGQLLSTNGTTLNWASGINFTSNIFEIESGSTLRVTGKGSTLVSSSATFNWIAIE